MDNEFNDFYNQAVDIANCVLGDLETKIKVKNKGDINYENY